VQAIVNTMGVGAMAAFAAASRVDDFAYTPQQNIGHAMTTLMAQNRGAGKKDRMRQGFRCGMRIEFLYGVAISLVCFFGAAPIMHLFLEDEAAFALGVRFLRTVSLLYLMPAATNGIQGFFRGIGQLPVTLHSSLLNMAARVAAAALFVLALRLDIEALPASYAVGWLAMLVYEVPLLIRYWKDDTL
jgi:Na+-driven multidrug efflux pump